jgi:hypothetical protein
MPAISLDAREVYRLPAVRIQCCKLARAQEDRLFRQATAALDPGAYRRWIGRGYEARLAGRRVELALAVEPARSMEAEDGSPCDADALLWDHAQHERAGRDAGPVNNDPLARLADHREQLQKRANFAAWTRHDSHVGARGNS